MTKVLLQMGDNDDIADANQHQKKFVSLCDNTGKNFLHRHFGYYYLPTCMFQVIRFAIATAPKLLNQRDMMGNTPLGIAVAKARNTKFPTVDRKEEYRLIKLLVYCLEFYARDRIGDPQPVNANVLSQGAEDDYSRSEIMDEDYEPYIDIAARRNVFQTACLLPPYLCTLDLIRYLLDPSTSALEASERSTHNPLIDVATEVDVHGNTALHLFVSNKCWSGGSFINADIEQRVIESILDRNGAAIFTVNGDNMLPLQLAMQSGRRRAVTALVSLTPRMALRVDDMNDPKLFVQLLNLISQAHQHGNTFVSLPRGVILTTLFLLLRDRPEIMSHY